MEVEGIKEKIVEIKEFIINADILVYVDEDDTDGIKKRIKQLIEATFVMEDVLDDYVIFIEQDPRPRPRPPGCATSSCGIFDFIKDTIRRHQIKCMFEKLDSQFGEIRDKIIKEAGGQIQSTSEQEGSRSGENQLTNLQPQYRTNDDVVVGFDSQSAQLIDCLVKGKEELTVISVVGMGGVGKTTHAKKVFNSKVVRGHFDCCIWITVSPSYTVKGLLKDLLYQFYNQESSSPPPGIFAMDRDLLVDQVRSYLEQKRYIVFFDDVWNRNFWYAIQLVLIDNRKGSRVFITTRNMDVAEACKSSSFVHVHQIQPLALEESLELFRMKAFQFDYKGNYPKDLEEMTCEIVCKCGGLPLALVLIGSSLSHLRKNVFEWKRFSRDLSSLFGNNSDLHDIRKILNTSYEVLPSHLKVCLLYFAIYPEGYEVKSNRLIRQWIAEGFVKEESGKTLEEVANGYLTELVRRSLVQELSVNINGETKGCCAHDLVRELILEKVYHLCFSRFISDGQYLSSGIIRHLSIATSFLDSIENIESSHVRSLHFFKVEELPTYLEKRIPTKYKRLNVIDFENVRSLDVPENLEDLIHLKYLSYRNTEIQCIPNSIGNLQSLETLDLRQTNANELPKEISKLTKLRHLLGTNLSLIHLKGEIGGMKALQTLSEVKIYEDGIELITELGKLTQLRKLGLFDVREEQGIALCSSINEMPHLEKLYIETKSKDITIDFSLVSNPAMLQKLRLKAKINKLPEWIPRLENLLELSMSYSQLTKDPLESLQNLPNLLVLNLAVHSYDGECLHFQQGGFQNLKELGLRYLYNLESIIIEQGALQSLKKLTFMNIPNLKTAPSGVNYLVNLDVLNTRFMPIEFQKNIAPFSKLVKYKKL